jgi:hypothetical protein
MSKSLLSVVAVLVSSILAAQEFVDRSPLVQLVENESLVARSMRVTKVTQNLPYSVNQIPNVGPSESEKFRWCQVEAVAQNTQGTDENITLFLPMIVNSRFSYPLDERYYKFVKTDYSPKTQFQPSLEPRLGMQLYYPMSANIIEGSQLLVISESANRIVPMAAILLATRPRVHTREPRDLFPHIIDSFKFQTDWQARQVAYWIEAYPIQKVLQWRESYPLYRSGNELHRNIARLLSIASNNYRKAKICETGYHLFADERLSWKRGESRVADDFGPQYFIHKINAMGLADSYYELGLDPAIRMSVRTYPITSPDFPESTRARSIKLLNDQGVLSLELQEFIINQFHLMSGPRKHLIGAKLLSFEDQSRLVNDLEDLLVPPHQKSNLSIKQEAVYQAMKQESFEMGRSFIQEFCRWKLGRPTAEWFPRE